MSNQPEKTTEQLEQEQQREITKQLETSVKFGNYLRELRQDKRFKAIFEKLFLDDGLRILWENTRHLKEEQLKGRGSETNQDILKAIEGQIKSRLDFAGFLDTVLDDAQNAAEELQEMKEETK